MGNNSQSSNGSRVSQILQEDAMKAVPDGVSIIASVHNTLNLVSVQGSKEGMDASSKFMQAALPAKSVLSRSRALLTFAVLGAMVSLLIVLTIFFSTRTHTASAAEILSRASATTSFVPSGKVRHIVVTNSDDVSGSTGVTTDEVWLANGQDHLLVWKPATVGLGGVTLPYGGATLVTDDGVWQFSPDGKTVTKLAFFAGALSLDGFLPNQAAIDKLMQDPQTKIIGTDTLQGRNVVIISGHVGSFVSGSPLDIASGKSKGYDTAQHDYKLWIDTQTYQIVQEQHYITWDNLGPTGYHKITSTKLVTTDEVLDSSSVSADLFTFKLPAGVTLTDLTTSDPWKITGPTPEPQHNGWYEFTSEPGNFGLLMPKTPDQGSTDNSSTGHTEYLIGARAGGYSYVARYADYPQDLLQKTGVEKWLDNERDYIVASVPGKLISERSISLNGYPGREIKVLAGDGKFRICRLYIVNSRFYNVYVVMPDQNSTSTQVEQYLDSFRLLKP